MWRELYVLETCLIWSESKKRTASADSIPLLSSWNRVVSWSVEFWIISYKRLFIRSHSPQNRCWKPCAPENSWCWEFDWDLHSAKRLLDLPRGGTGLSWPPWAWPQFQQTKANVGPGLVHRILNWSNQFRLVAASGQSKGDSRDAGAIAVGPTGFRKQKGYR